MPVVTRRELLEAGMHFGHQTRRWNPKMSPYLFGERSGIYIIDLEKSLTGLEEAYKYAFGLGKRGGNILFVGTKKQAQEVVSMHATRANMPFVNTRWLGGMLTNFQTISKRLVRLRELREMERGGAMDYLPKKEVIRLRNEREKLERNLGGIQDLEKLPDAVFIIDTNKEHIAVGEARKLGLPVIAVVDTNCDPDEVDFVIPGNDDAIRALSLVARVICEGLEDGRRGSSKLDPEISPEPEAAALSKVDEDIAPEIAEVEDEIAPEIAPEVEAEPKVEIGEPAPEAEVELPEVTEGGGPA